MAHARFGAPADASWVIRGGLILGAPSGIVREADLVIRGDTIDAVGPPGMKAPETAAVLDASDRLVMPGLVNAHTHGHGNLVKGAGDRWTLELLLNAGSWLNGHRTEEDHYLTCLLGGLEMIRSGTTACYDLFYEFPLPSLEGLDAAARGYRDAGLRSVLAPMVADHSFYEAIPGLGEALPEALSVEVSRFRTAPARATLDALHGIARGWSYDSAESALALAPTIPLHCSDAFLAGCRDLARDAGLGLHVHVAESKVQVVSGIRRYGKTLIAHLDELGLLGPQFTAAHAVWVDDDELARLADRGASVAHNPGSNLRLGSGVAPLRRMRDRGLNVGIGTDGAHCSDNQNMFEAMRLASFVSRIRSPDPERWLATGEAFAMATEASARALGWGARIGRIAPGFKADLVLLDLNHPELVPLRNPVNQLVHSASGAAVDSVIIGGRMVLDRGRFPGVDMPRLRARIADRVAALRERNRALAGLATRLESIVSRFCVGLARTPYHVQCVLPE